MKMLGHKFYYHSFGMIMPNRTYSDSTGYRFGFNGMEKVDEMSGKGNNLDFGARIYDSRLGRWLSVDPLMKKFPFSSPYNGLGNNPIRFKDLDGRDIDDGKMINPSTGKYYDSYKFFKMTQLGTQILKDFTNGKGDSKWSDLMGGGGKMDKQGHTLRIRMREPYKYNYKTGERTGDIWYGGTGGFAETRLKVGDREVLLGNVSAEDVKNSNFQFVFVAVLNYNTTSDVDATILGHEIFLHTQNTINAIKDLQNKIEGGEIQKNDYEKIAKELNKIQKDKGAWGDNDHKEILNPKSTKAKTYFNFLAQLRNILPKEKQNKVDEHLTEEKNQYKNK